MTANPPGQGGTEWASTSGDIWADRWRDTDAALQSLSPLLVSAIAAEAPAVPFRAFEIGCGAGSTAIAVADALPDATIVACDISPSLAGVAARRTADRPAIGVVVGDAEELSVSEGPFDLFFSRHGVMFFADPVRAFGKFRSAAKPGASVVFSCFRSWASNPWASALAEAAAGKALRPPGREPGGFAFADPDHVVDILSSSGWSDAESQPVDFTYVAGEGPDAIERACAFLSVIGPAARIIQGLPEDEKPAALARMRDVLEAHSDGGRATFPAAVWIWRARAGGDRS